MLSLWTIGSYAQTETKTYKETFNVGEDAVLDINTSHTDIEFETWDKNQVVIEGEITLEGASKEEADNYFKNGGFDIVGNSKSIKITTGAENTWLSRHTIGSIGDLNIEIPELPDLEPLFLDLEIPEIAEFPEYFEMPPMPPIPFTNFDYDAYQKDGEKYMKEWKKEFDKSFDDNYKERMEDWSERMAERAEVWKERQEQRQDAREERMRERTEMMKEREEKRKERMKDMEERRKTLFEERHASDSTRVLFLERDGRHSAPNIFFHSSHGKNKNYKIKKTIKVKMPKSTKLKMNVRHGEVKLAENTRNIKATLSYSRLLATTIDGDRTNIVASYSPVTVQQWDQGSLNTNFSEPVSLRDVKHLTLSANSSDVTIGRLLNSALIKNNLGALRINSVSKNFSGMDISLQNGELICELPSTPYTVYVNGTSSKLSSPSYLVLDRTMEGKATVHRGFHINKNSGKSIKIESKYSDVVLEE